MAKKVPIGAKPAIARADGDDWVSSRAIPEEPQAAIKMKRLTIDISEGLHKAIKRQALEEGVPMADMLRDLLDSQYLTKLPLEEK